MTAAYKLTPELRVKLKTPFGNLIEGTPDQTMAKMKEIAEIEQMPKIISVGDVVSRNLHEYNIHPQLTIIDNVSLRDHAMPEEATVDKKGSNRSSQESHRKWAAHSHSCQGRGRLTYANRGFVRS
jgi:uncharacterized protein (UPF0218 family)